jgi:hypothetical protein
LLKRAAELQHAEKHLLSKVLGQGPRPGQMPEKPEQGAVVAVEEQGKLAYLAVAHPLH